MKLAASRIKGFFAFVAISKDEPDRICALKRSNPLVIGIGNGEPGVLVGFLDQLHRGMETIRVRFEIRLVFRGISPQGQQVVDSQILDLLEVLPDLIFGLADDVEVAHRFHFRIVLKAAAQVQGQILGGTSGSVGHREESGTELFELLYGLEKLFHPFRGFGREQLDRYIQCARLVELIESHRL